ncbi:hypothetical protein ABIE41_001139 [Bosea sp. OAE506]
MRGRCRLTKSEGKFVRSHLIPRALTKLSPNGEKMLEYGQGLDKVILRPTSWYDNELVTDKGESILARYDTRGVNELRRLGVVWSSEGHSDLVHDSIDAESGWGLTRLQSDYPEHLRMFFLSLLWRCAASQKFEFADISIPEDDLEYLRFLCLSGNRGNEDDFPTTLIVMSTKGDPHNHTPRRVTYPRPDGAGQSFPAANYFRFYFDGLVVLMGQKPKDADLLAETKNNSVGFDKSFFAMSVPYERSAQRDNLIQIVKSAIDQARH